MRITEVNINIGRQRKAAVIRHLDPRSVTYFTHTVVDLDVAVRGGTISHINNLFCFYKEAMKDVAVPNLSAFKQAVE